MNICKYIAAVFFLVVASPSWAQENATLLIIPNTEAKIKLDGIEKGNTKAGEAMRLVTTEGEHYVEAQAVNGIVKGEIVNLEPNKQKILKFEFDTAPTPTEVIAVAELNFDLPGAVEVLSWQSANQGLRYPYPEYYCAFEKGDEVTLNLTMSNKNGTNQISISTYPDGVERFSNNAFTELTDFKIKIPERSIYRFIVATNHAFARNAFLKISRKPVAKETVNFNTKVIHKKTLTPVAVIEPQSFFVNSGSNATFLGGKSRVIVPVTLPPNTAEWFYRFSASRNAADIDNVKKNFSLLGDVSNLVFSLTGAGAAVSSLTIEKLSQPPGANYCDVFFLDQQNIQAFQAKEDGQWQYYLEGSRQNLMSGNVKVTCCNTGQFYLGIRNPDNSYGLNVSIEVVALTVNEIYAMASE